MESDEDPTIFIFPTESNDVNFTGNGGDHIAGAAGTDVITLTLPEDYSYDSHGSYDKWPTTITSPSTTTMAGPMGPPGSAGSIYIGSSGAISGSTLTSTGIGGSTWTTTPTLSVAGYEHSATIQISGKNPKLKTDETEIDINELSGVVEAIKQIMDTNELPIFDRAFRDKHEILQKSWEDVKQAYENYRITEALLKSTPPGDDDDQ